MFVIAGATGNTGSVVVDSLLAKGKKVRGLVRNEEGRAKLEKQGAEAVVVDLDDRAALTRAFESAEGAYILSPPDMGATDFLPQRRKTFDAIGDAIDAAKLPHVVLLSSAGAQHATGTGIIASLHDAEERLKRTSAKTTFVRAAYFLDNWFQVLDAVKAGALPTFLRPDHVIPMVSSKDIGVSIANALLEKTPGVIELSGPKDQSSNDIAEVFSKITGKPIAVQAGPLDAIVPTYTSFGISPNVAELFRGMYEGIANGTVDFERSGATRQIRGTHSPEETFRQLLK